MADDYGSMNYSQLRALIDERFPMLVQDMPALSDMPNNDLALWAAYVHANCAPVCWRERRLSYDDALIADIVPELIRRLCDG